MTFKPFVVKEVNLPLLKERDPEAWKRAMLDKIGELDRRLNPPEPDPDGDSWMAGLADETRDFLSARAIKPFETEEERAAGEAEKRALEEEMRPVWEVEARAKTRQRLRAAGWETRVIATITSPGFRSEGPYADALSSIDPHEGGIVVLVGGVGSGKTTEAAHWAAGWPGGYPMFLRAAAFARSSKYGEERDKLLTRNALVLDDLGAEYADKSGNFAADFDELVDRFYAGKNALVITTNILWGSPAQRSAAKAKGVKVDESQPTFLERYGERVYDRIRQCGKWVSVEGPSKRRPK